MPFYLFQDPDTEEVIEIFFHMDDKKEYSDEDGKKWKRIFTKPNAAIDTKVDPYSQKDFVKVTNKPGTMGQLWERSKELSEKRKDKDGIDPVQEKHFDQQQKKTGLDPFERRRRKAQEKLKEKGVILE